MLYSEYLTALLSVVPEAREENVQRTYDAACDVYRMPRLDEVCSGPDRHVALCRWIVAHQRLFSRYLRMRDVKRWRRVRELREMKATIDFELMLLG